MSGQEVFRKAVIAMTESALTSIENAGLTPEDIAFCDTTSSKHKNH